MTNDPDFPDSMSLRPPAKDHLIALALAAGFLALYALTVPGNHSEAEDAFNYALKVERNQSSDILTAEHVLYGPIMRKLFTAAHALGIADRAYPLMLGVSLVCGAASLAVLFLLLRRTMGLTVLAAGLTTSLTGLSYGFWRYSCETEIYIPAILVALLALWIAAPPDTAPWRVILAAGLGAWAALLHAFAAIPALAGIPVLYLVQRRVRSACLYAILAGVVALPPILFLGAGQFTDGLDAARPAAAYVQPVKEAVGALTQAIVSGNFLFCLEPFRLGIQHLYPYRTLAEEVYMGQYAGARAAILPMGTLTALLLAAGAGCLLTLRHDRRNPSRDAAAPQPGRRGLLAAAALWLTLHVALVLWYEPGNPENWILAIPAFWILAGVAFIQPLTRAAPAVAMALAVLLSLHNYFGGMRLVASRESDYNAKKAEWLLAHATRDDLVLTCESPVFVRYLRYGCPARVKYLLDANPTQVQRRLTQRKPMRGRVYATPDLFDPPAPLRMRYPRICEAVVQAMAPLAPGFREIAPTPFGGVFVWDPPPPPAAP